MRGASGSLPPSTHVRHSARQSVPSGRLFPAGVVPQTPPVKSLPRSFLVGSPLAGSHHHWARGASRAVLAGLATRATWVSAWSASKPRPAGALGLHRAAVVQYIGPSWPAVIGFFPSRPPAWTSCTGSALIARFLLGVAPSDLVLLRPWRAPGSVVGPHCRAGIIGLVGGI